MKRVKIQSCRFLPQSDSFLQVEWHRICPSQPPAAAGHSVRTQKGKYLQDHPSQTQWRLSSIYNVVLVSSVQQSNISALLYIFLFRFYSLMCVRSHFSHVRLFETLWTVACQAPLSMEFSRQEYWSGLPFPTPLFPYRLWQNIEYTSLCYTVGPCWLSILNT